MTTSTPKDKKSGFLPTKQEGRINRDKDTGWGYAIAHIIPLVGIYYACTRRTITPMAYAIFGNFILGVFIAIASPEFIEGERGDKHLQLISFLSTPLLVKAGISKSRKDKTFALPETY